MLQVNQTSSGGPVGFSDSLICGFVFRQSSHRSWPIDEEIQVRGGRSRFEVVGSEAWLVLLQAKRLQVVGLDWWWEACLTCLSLLLAFPCELALARLACLEQRLCEFCDLLTQDHWSHEAMDSSTHVLGPSGR